MAIVVRQASPMVGKQVKFAITSKERLEKSNKIFQQVEMYIDNETGTLYVVPIEDMISEIHFKMED